MSLTTEEFKKVVTAAKSKLFLFKPPKGTHPEDGTLLDDWLRPPKNTDDTTVPNSLASRLNSIAIDPRFTELGIGVVDFTAVDFTVKPISNPRVWLHNGEKAWRVFSTGKIAILLAAAQLRDDVRKVAREAKQEIKRNLTPSDFDSLFKEIWKESGVPKIKEIAGENSCPRISTVFDVTKNDAQGEPWPDFIGAGPLNRAMIFNRLPGAGNDRHLTWNKAKEFSFWERLCLTGALSDNVAATTCISEIGVAYMKAVLRAYGLFNDSSKKGLLLGGGYVTAVDTNADVNLTGTPKYRKLRNTESQWVSDLWPSWNQQQCTMSHWSSKPGTAAALTAYMIALMQDRLVDEDGCNMIRTHLADGEPYALKSWIVEGVKDSGVTVARQHTKIGVGLGVDCQNTPIGHDCEFAYLEAGGLKYAVLVTGILPKAPLDVVDRTKALGEAVHRALWTPVVVSPKDGQQVLASSFPAEVQFQWHAAPEAVGFELDIDYNQVLINNGTTHNKTLNQGAHQWKIRAKYSSNQYGPWSNNVSFTLALQ